MDELIQNYLGVFRKFADFDGRARRREFWMFWLGNIVAFVVLGLLGGLLGRLGSLLLGILALLSIAVIVPTIAVSVRRLHDTGRPGWWYLLTFVPLGAFVLLYFYLQDSEPGTNEYGPNPKASFAYA